MAIKAAAEPRDTLDRPGKESSPSIPVDSTDENDLEIESVPGRSSTHEPVDDILAFILKHSEAEAAIAHKETCTLCAGRSESM